ncbi:MerR family transcriptional regulator [Saccharibacillus sp. CPCC 101409]|uniref:MerR family transcriptional regulator n=1 Tax=Saccharibacillus sp. CPCC 101409 TaxID=3058041 RepID=UPI0026726D53|nr:MerR family transcriptional regulator [Saccharibacillus sp. CPCC 101409]MDO3411745.1 MerR family transcriptional regulator [Saccharibacillus sp. CPCC 101409]
MYTVKEAAIRTGLSEHAVRFYTDKGLVPSVRRSENNIRLFDEEAINWLYGIKCLKRSGLAIESIKTYVDLCLEGDATVPQRYEMMQAYRDAALVQLEEAKQRVAHMEQKIVHYQAVLESGIPDATNPASWDTARATSGSGS